MAYTSYVVHINNLAKSPKNDWIDDYQAFITEEFYNTSDWFTIQEETTFGTGTYSNVDARINHVFNPTTGVNVGDDWKILMFSDIDKSLYSGMMFLFDSNYWLAVNTESTKTLTSSCIVRRCNNTLRWLSETGGLYTVPCVLDYSINENRNYSSAMSAMVNPSGLLRVTSQLNSKSNKIKPNQRFLFGNADNWIGYKVQGGGINNFDNEETLSNTSSKLLDLTLGVDFANAETDDLTNGIANVYEHVYTIEIIGATSGTAGNTSQLTANVYLNGVSVTRSVTWTSSATTKATVSSTGLVTFVSAGTSNITATLADNTSVTDTVAVSTVATAPNAYDIRISPAQNYVLEGLTQTFTVTLYLDGVAQPDTFVFTLDANTVPSSKYVYTAVDGNHFRIQNAYMYLEDNLEVTCVSGANSETFTISLRGGW